MKNEVITFDTLIQPGLCGLLYGPWGCGKTTALLDLPGRLVIYSTEAKDIKRTIHEWFKRNPDQRDKYIKIIYISTIEEALNSINELSMRFEKGKRPVDSVGFDTLSFLQMETKIDFEDSRFKDAKKEGKREDILVDKYRLEQADWGGVKSAMMRLTGPLNRLARHNLYVFCTSAMTEKPKVDRTLDGAPDFEGGYASIAAGYFDLVGAVLKGDDDINVDEDYPYPPKVTFNHPDYLTRCCSDILMKRRWGKLDMKKIIEICERK